MYDFHLFCRIIVYNIKNVILDNNLYIYYCCIKSIKNNMKKLSIIAGLILAPLFSAQLVHQPVQSFQTEAYTSKKKAFVDKLIAK